MQDWGFLANFMLSQNSVTSKYIYHLVTVMIAGDCCILRHPVWAHHLQRLPLPRVGGGSWMADCGYGSHVDPHLDDHQTLPANSALWGPQGEMDHSLICSQCHTESMSHRVNITQTHRVNVTQSQCHTESISHRVNITQSQYHTDTQSQCHELYTYS